MKQIPQTLRVVNDEISQAQLRILRSHDIRIKKMKECLEREQYRRDEAAAEILDMIKAGCTVKKGKYMLKVVTVKGRRVPRYKDVLTELFGERYVSEIIAKTETGKDKTILEVI